MNLSLNFLSVAKMAADDYVGFTFFVGCMAMMAASVFFFLSMNSFDMSKLFIDKKKNTDAAIIAIHPTKNVNPT